MLRAILCELEGVLVQTSGLRRVSMARAVASLGGSLPDDWRSEITEPPIVPAEAASAALAAGLDADETTVDLLGLAASRSFVEALTAGGVTLVQSPAEAPHPSMPRNAIARDHVGAAMPVCRRCRPCLAPLPMAARSSCEHR